MAKLSKHAQERAFERFGITPGSAEMALVGNYLNSHYDYICNMEDGSQIREVCVGGKRIQGILSEDRKMIVSVIPPIHEKEDVTTYSDYQYIIAKLNKHIKALERKYEVIKKKYNMVCSAVDSSRLTDSDGKFRR